MKATSSSEETQPPSAEDEQEYDITNGTSFFDNYCEMVLWLAYNIFSCELTGGSCG